MIEGKIKLRIELFPTIKTLNKCSNTELEFEEESRAIKKDAELMNH